LSGHNYLKSACCCWCTRRLVLLRRIFSLNRLKSSRAVCWRMLGSIPKNQLMRLKSEQYLEWALDFSY